MISSSLESLSVIHASSDSKTPDPLANSPLKSNQAPYKPSPSKLSKSLLTSLLIVLCVGSGLTALWSASLADLLSVAQATLRGGEQTPVELPHHWQNTSGSESLRSYEFVLDSAEFERVVNPSDESLFLFLPYFEQRVYLTVNGTQLSAPSIEEPRRNPLSHPYGRVRIPNEMLRDGENSFVLDVDTGSRPSGSVSQIYFGTDEMLRVPIALFDLLTVDLRIISIGTELVLAFYCLVVFVAYPKDTLFGWLSGALLSAVLCSVSMMNDLFPILAPWQSYFPILLPLFGFSFLGFAYRFSERPVPLFVKFGTLVLPALSLFFTANQNFGDRVFDILIIPSFFLSFAGAGFLIIRHALFARTNHGDVFLVSMMTFALAICFNIAIRYGLVPVTLPVAILARLFVVSAVIIYLVRRTNAAAFERESKTLRTKLKQQQVMLEELFAEKQSRNDEIAAARERQRITAELHDGVAGHLVTILALTESPDDQRASVKSITRHALDELRVVIDALGNDSITLQLALAYFRERCLDPLSRTGIEVHCAINSSERQLSLSPSESLNLFRILQEATTNAVRHGKPKSISFTAELTQDSAVLVLRNEGGAELPREQERQKKIGSGLENMKARTAKLSGGELELRRIPSGAELKLSFGSTPARSQALPNRIS